MSVASTLGDSGGHGRRDGRRSVLALCAAVLGLLATTASCPSAAHAAPAPSATPCPWERGHTTHPRGGWEEGMGIKPPAEDRRRWCHAGSPSPQPGESGHTSATSPEPSVSSSAPPQPVGNGTAVPQTGASSGAAPPQPAGDRGTVPQPPPSRSAAASTTSPPDASLLRSRPLANAPGSGIWPIGSILLIVLGVALAVSTLF